MLSTPSRIAHCSTVKMRLWLNGAALPIAQLGPDFAILAEPHPHHAPGAGEIEVMVDDTTDRFAVQLPAGIAEGAQRIAISATR
jgi:hypothetical protein